MNLLVAMAVAGSSLFMTWQKTDFSGTYLLNKTKTDLGPAPEWILPRYITVAQQPEKCVINRTSLNQQLQEQVPVSDTLPFNSAIVVKVLGNGKSADSRLAWNGDNSFTITRTIRRADNMISGTTIEQWRLEEDGKVLILNRSVEQSNGMKYTTRAVYDRK